MPEGARLEGVEQLAKLSRRLRDAKDKDLKREFNRGLRGAGQTFIRAARGNARDYLPKRGGLAEKVAASKIVFRNQLTGRNPVLRIVATNSSNIAAMNAGRIRHPVFGHRDRWVTQMVRPGWWSDARTETGPEVMLQLAETLDRIDRQLSRPL